MDEDHYFKNNLDEDVGGYVNRDEDENSLFFSDENVGNQHQDGDENAQGCQFSGISGR